MRGLLYYNSLGAASDGGDSNELHRRRRRRRCALKSVCVAAYESTSKAWLAGAVDGTGLGQFPPLALSSIAARSLESWRGADLTPDGSHPKRRTSIALLTLEETDRRLPPHARMLWFSV